MKIITREFHRDEMAELTRLVKGKAIEAISTDEGQNDFLVFTFTDGTKLLIEYDWIYEWTIQTP